MKNRVIDGQSQTGQSMCLPMVPWMAIASRMTIETVIFIFVDRVVIFIRKYLANDYPGKQ